MENVPMTTSDRARLAMNRLVMERIRRLLNTM